MSNNLWRVYRQNEFLGIFKMNTEDRALIVGNISSKKILIGDLLHLENIDTGESLTLYIKMRSSKIRNGYSYEKVTV